MTKEEIMLEKELLKEGAKLCKGRELCKDCPNNRHDEYEFGGCFEKVALKKIIELTRQIDKLKKQLDNAFVLDITTVQQKEFISRCEELDAEPEEILSELVRCLAWDGNGSDERELANNWFERESANYSLF